jgi:hypothetical protein
MDQSALTFFANRPGRWLAIALVSTALLAGCSHKHNVKTAKSAPQTAEATTPESGGFMTGGPGLNKGDAKFVAPDQDTDAVEPAPMEQGPSPKFVAPKVTGKGAPSLASVPDKAPKAPTARQEREKLVEGLVADRERAHYTDSGGRTMPVAVRPLSEAAAQLDEEPAAPPTPKAAKVGTVTKLGTQPTPGKKAAKETREEKTAAATEGEPDAKAKASLDAAARLAATSSPPAMPAMEGPQPSSLPAVRSDGFRTLTAYQATTSVSNLVASIDFSGKGVSITTVARKALSDAAQLGTRSKGAFRVIGRSAEPSNLVQDRATAVARELQRLGVTQDRIYVGTDAGQDGRVDVILDQ